MQTSYAVWEPSHRPPAAPAPKNRSSCVSINTVLFFSSTIANIALYIIGVWLNDWLLDDLQSNPFVGLNAAGLERIGATSTHKIVYDYQYWRLLSSLFVNAGAIQIWANNGIVWAFGGFLSCVMPTWQLVVVYFASGIIGVLSAANIANQFITAGASGPAFGFMGATCMLLLLRNHAFVMQPLAWLLMILILGLNCFMGSMPYVDNACNVGGFVVGALLAACFLLAQSTDVNSRGEEIFLTLCSAAAVTVVLALLVLGFVGLNTGLPAGACCNDVLVCVPSSLWDCNAARVYSTECTFKQYLNGSVVMLCPKGGVYQVPGVNFSSPSAAQAVCLGLCNT